MASKAKKVKREKKRRKQQHRAMKYNLECQQHAVERLREMLSEKAAEYWVRVAKRDETIQALVEALSKLQAITGEGPD